MSLRELDFGRQNQDIGPSITIKQKPMRSRIPLYIGTYTSKESEGIYRCMFDMESGALSDLMLAVRAEQPSFLALHPSRQFLYAVNELMEYEGEVSGAVSAFAIDSAGTLRFLNRQSSKGGAPCHVTVDDAGRWLMIANYAGGNAVMYPLHRDGMLGPPAHIAQHEGSGPNENRQKAPHAHSVTLDPQNRILIVADLGIDRLAGYQIDHNEGTLTTHAASTVQTHPGAGPRHFTFHPSGRFAYVINELDSTVIAYAFDRPNAALTPIQTLSTLPEDFDGTSWCADIHVSPNGRFLYGSNRGHDSIAIFQIDPQTGRMTAAGHQSTLGDWPRNFTLDPAGRFLLVANQNSDTIQVFMIDQETGALSATGHMLEVSMPVCLLPVMM